MTIRKAAVVRRRVCRIIGPLVLLALLSVLIGTPTSSAQTGWLAQPETVPVDAVAAPPELGPVVLEDPLTAPGLVQASQCPTSRNERLFVGEGLMFKVTGKCTDTSTTAGVSRRLEGLRVPDGEVRVEFKLVTGQERAIVRIWFRDQGSPGDSYAATLIPSAGYAHFSKLIGGQSTLVAERTDLAGLVYGDWNTLAVRARGPDFWLLINDQPVLTATVGELSNGGVVLDLGRRGSVEDSDETAVVWRNLRVSALTGSDQARVPTGPQPAAPPPLAVAPVAPSGDPWVGDIRFGYDPNGQGSVPSGSSLKIREGPIYAFFSWRNIPAGAAININVLFNNQGQHQRDFNPPAATGSSRSVMVNFLGGAEGGGYYTLTSINVIYSSGGREVARGSLGLSG